VVDAESTAKNEIIEALRPFRLNGAINISLISHN